MVREVNSAEYQSFESAQAADNKEAKLDLTTKEGSKKYSCSKLHIHGAVRSNTALS